MQMGRNGEKEKGWRMEDGGWRMEDGGGAMYHWRDVGWILVPNRLPIHF